jgi:XTP/dITP diphosphohydrolase
VRILLASRNRGKVREIAQVLAELGVDVVGLDAVDDSIPEPDETGATFAENARDKARYYACQTGQWCLADDSGLVVDALDGEPGIYSARYAADDLPATADRDAIDRANNRKLLERLEGVAEENRTARFVCHLALAEGETILLEADGVVEGRIAHEEAGENGFGYDPLFYVPEFDCTTAQMTPDRKNAISHRGRAVRDFAAKLKALLADR